MIIEFEPNKILLSYPIKWCLCYKEDNSINFKQIYVIQEQLILFLETYGYETHNVLELNKFGVDTSKIKNNINLI